jgi:hypothetical protein
MAVADVLKGSAVVTMPTPDVDLIVDYPTVEVDGVRLTTLGPVTIETAPNQLAVVVVRIPIRRIETARQGDDGR